MSNKLPNGGFDNLTALRSMLRLIDTLKQSLAHADRYGCHPIYRRDLNERLEVAQREAK